MVKRFHVNQIRKYLVEITELSLKEAKLMRNFFLISALLMLSACATWSTSNVKIVDDSQTITDSSTKQKSPQDIFVTEKDIGDRKYKVLGDIEVTVNKTTIFHKDPTREMVNEKLRKEASKLGADAVILVRYGTGGMSMMSYGALNGKGRAIVFLD
jgi:uncharacterized protein YbjQ (UPF0145 family)